MILISELTANIEKAFSSENLIITGVGYLIVFAALVLLFIVFNNIPKLLNINIKKTLVKKGKIQNTNQIKDSELEVSGEVNAAIGMALYYYFEEVHDDEEGILTIKRVSRNYSPWSSKIYGLTHTPNKKQRI